MTPEERENAAGQLLACYQTGIPIDPLAVTYPDITLDDAYQVQLAQVERRVGKGERVVGQKVGLTSSPMRRALGVDQPDYGHVFDSMVHQSGGQVDTAALIAPRVEPEVAFVLERNLTGPGITPVAAARAVAFCLPALEIIDSRIREWKITLYDTIADNGSSGAIVLGERPMRVTDLDLRLVGCLLSKGGKLVASGAGAEVLGNPLSSLAWLANALASRGVGLPEGSIVMSGSITAPVDVAPGDRVEAEFDRLGSVETTFVEGQSD